MHMFGLILIHSGQRGAQLRGGENTEIWVQLCFLKKKGALESKKKGAAHLFVS